VRVTAAGVILFAVTGLFAVLVVAALVTGMALTPGGRGFGRMRFVRRASEPGRYWFTVIVDGAVLAFCAWMDLHGNR
jgi:hypothetical protein